MIVINGDLARASGGGQGHLAGGVQPAQQRVGDSFGGIRSGIPAFQDGVQTLIRRVAGDGASVKVNADHRLAQLLRLPDEGVLAGGQVDVSAIHALAHGGDGAGAVLAAQGQQNHVSQLGDFDGFRKQAFIRPCLVIAGSVQNADVRQCFR